MCSYKDLFLGVGKGRWYKGNVMTPLNIMLFIVALLAGKVLISEVEIWIKIFACIIISIILLFWMFSYLFFMIKDPDRLQTEKYNIEQRKLDIQEKTKLKDVTPAEFEGTMIDSD